MKILILGGTRYFGIPMVEKLISLGYDITIATRGITSDCFGDSVSRLVIDRHNAESIKDKLYGKYFDIVYDKIAYCSNDIKYLLDIIKCGKYIYMSSTAVYKSVSMDIKESDFDPYGENVVWCSREDFPYDEVKRQAEYALWQNYPHINAIAVRYPVVLGKDDYTKRLEFYAERIIKQVPMYIDNIDCQMSFINSNEAGDFLAFLADKDYKGAVNGSSYGTISLSEIISYIENKTGKKAVLDNNAESAPYNSQAQYSINTDIAKNLGYKFSHIDSWIYKLLDIYIEKYKNLF